MYFSEAMELLKNGHKVTRECWKNQVYFELYVEQVRVYERALSNYTYESDIMNSTGWEIFGNEGEYSFCEILPMLLKGSKACLNDWENKYIMLDKQTKSLVLSSVIKSNFIPDFMSFLAMDWIEINE